MRTINAKELADTMFNSDCEPELSIIYSATFKDEDIIFNEDIEEDFYCDYEPDIPAILDNYEVFC